MLLALRISFRSPYAHKPLRQPSCSMYKQKIFNHHVRLYASRKWMENWKWEKKKSSRHQFYQEVQSTSVNVKINFRSPHKIMSFYFANNTPLKQVWWHFIHSDRVKMDKKVRRTKSVSDDNSITIWCWWWY